MPRREPKPAPDFAVDFLADWRTVVHVDNPPAVAQGWTLHGTVRKHGKTYALAWRRGMTSACNERGDLLSLTALERSHVSLAVEFKSAPGWETVPKYERPPGPFMFTWGG
ncbi:hypothetical protein [Dyella lutea]|jgi:hypothetical protein|uniref:Uncharacterized protein n=1 Tax=Dyella lutea TaxID=2950441 RepID=A0ABT1F5H2_9GAMM|nr:hypothetical protein [Dyella lutea]MCP1372629.1 hypothetical protein [Dyella lutea]